MRILSLSNNSVKYFGLHINQRLKSRKLRKAKRQQLDSKNQTTLLVNLSGISTWRNINAFHRRGSCSLQLKGMASNCNVEILQEYQSKTLCVIPNTPQLAHSSTTLFTKGELNAFIQARVSCQTEWPGDVNPLATSFLDEFTKWIALKRHHIPNFPFRN